ncbi:MAG: peptide-methionine (R)-S-oxide reductase MsrB [Saprospiraceae bacterium]
MRKLTMIVSSLFSLFLIFTSCKSSDKNMVLDQKMEQDSVIVLKDGKKIPKVYKSDAEWKSELSPEQYYVMREAGTERAFTGKYYNNHEEGRYACSACGIPLFDSKTKFDSGTGWPSFYAPEDPNVVREDKDNKLGYTRTEVLCARCGGHLGHVFNDGPKPTGLRYCINSVCLEFIPDVN